MKEGWSRPYFSMKVPIRLEYHALIHQLGAPLHKTIAQQLYLSSTQRCPLTRKEFEGQRNCARLCFQIILNIFVPFQIYLDLSMMHSAHSESRQEEAKIVVLPLLFVVLSHYAVRMLKQMLVSQNRQDGF